MEPKFSKNIFGTISEKKLAKPECFGRYLSTRIGNRSVIEFCSGLGIQLIQIAKNSNKPTIGVELNSKRAEKARRNAKLYKIRNVGFITGDALDIDLLKKLSAQVAIMDPHWSVSRTLQRDFAKRLKDTTPPTDKLIRLVRKHVTENIIVQLPSTIPNIELLALGECEIQDVYINGEFKQKFVYYGDMKESKTSKIKFEFDKGNIPQKLRTKSVV